MILAFKNCTMNLGLWNLSTSKGYTDIFVSPQKWYYIIIPNNSFVFHNTIFSYLMIYFYFLFYILNISKVIESVEIVAMCLHFTLWMNFIILYFINIHCQLYLGGWQEKLTWQVGLENRENFGDRNQLEILKVNHLR